MNHNLYPVLKGVKKMTSLFRGGGSRAPSTVKCNNWSLLRGFKNDLAAEGGSGVSLPPITTNFCLFDSCGKNVAYWAPF